MNTLEEVLFLRSGFRQLSDLLVNKLRLLALRCESEAPPVPAEIAADLRLTLINFRREAKELLERARKKKGSPQ